jgi:peptidoglycan/xylan/chitin deacetylase (PgdA/CDA1 family)
MIEFLRRRSRRLIANTLYYSGVLWLMASIRFHRKAFVLMYHRVLPAGADTFSADSICVRPETFARQMAFLRRHFRVLSIAELAEHLNSGRELPSRSCVVTFDDGWRDNFEHALPVLRDQQVPAVIFVATDFIGGDDCFWQERLSRLMFHAVRGGAAARTLVEQTVGSPGLGERDPADQRRIIRDAVDALKNRTQPEIAALEQRVRAALDGGVVSFGEDRFMDWAQVTALTQGTLVSVGSHGCTHTPLTKLSEEHAASELNEASRRIATAVGVPTASIGYPNGNYDDTVVSLTRAAGYQLGFTTDKGYVGDIRDPFKLPRINIHEGASSTMPDFLCAILLVFQRLRRAAPPKVEPGLHAHPRHG